MFASLKNKIKEETGVPVMPIQNNRARSRYSSTMSVNSNADAESQSHSSDHAMIDQLAPLRSQCNELTTKITELNTRLQTLQAQKTHVEKTNEILLETVKVAQTQKDLYCEEQEKIQNMQQSEIEKLKSLLSFREQEAVDRLSALHQCQQQVENLTAELERIKQFEPMVEDLRDELQRLRHASQLDKNSSTTTIAAIEEENRHLKSRLQIVEQTRLDTISTLNADEKLQTLVHERKLLAQHLEESQSQLSDIKSSWSGQNLALETQVSRLSQQVAEETTEKRKALKERDDCREQVKQLKFEMLKLNEETQQRNDKIMLLEEEIDELSLALKESRDENEQQIVYERNKSQLLETETKDLQTRLESSDERFTEYAANAESVALALRQQNTILKEKLHECQNQIDVEKDEKLTALLRNAEISQSEELLRKELRHERDDANEYHALNEKLKAEIKAKQQEAAESQRTLDEFKTIMLKNEQLLQRIDEIQQQVAEKNKTIKMLNQHVADLKKTLHKELNCTTIAECAGATENGHTAGLGATPKIKTKSIFYQNAATADEGGGIVMDEVNFKYLKHVIVKFLTSREVEARHLIRAVATLLKLSKEEEQLLHDTLNWKMSWFGAKPDHGSGQRAVSIPPS